MRVGLLGKKLSHSLSPNIHNFIYKKFNLNLNYELFEVEENEVNNFKAYMLENNIRAVNITIPYKKIFMDSLDSISENAKKIGAINLMYIQNNKFYGDNTDYYGFEYCLKKNNIDVKNKKIYILGKGGAASAVETVLKSLAATDINYLFRKDRKSKIEFKEDLSGDILINTTPVGMYPDICGKIVPTEIISKFKVAIDLIYNPLQTEFLKTATLFNLKAINGLEMLIEQAIKTDEILFNKKFDDSLREELKIYLENLFLGAKNE
ncbi:shikimate dehydrogenase family protein [Fusobacterium russii]|uniref:shikimate dehydrogenase family protein n=1 Tax=Fusobacterium russii TaxID=854 RepID=UPI0003A2AFCF|nr:shikimate dehydrogenase [Fusobacterium russii]